MANEGKSFGNPAKEYAQRVAIESFTKRPVETFQNEWMDRGVELEMEAREMYEMQRFCDVDNGGFMSMDRFGASSDGLVGEFGMIEIKSVKFNTHFERLRLGGVDNKYYWQMLGNLWVYGRTWCDFVSYCPDFPESKQLYVCRVEYNNEEAKRLILRLSEFIKEVDKNIKILQN